MERERAKNENEMMAEKAIWKPRKGPRMVDEMD